MHFFQQVWSWKTEPVPIIVAILLYFIPVTIRKYKKLMYTPMYFSVFPLANLNVDFGNYLGDYYFSEFVENEDEAEQLRKKIILRGIFSTVFDVLIIPAIMGFLWTFFLKKEQFYIALTCLIIILGKNFIQSTVNFSYYDDSSGSKKGLLGLFYFFVLGSIATIILYVKSWVEPFIQSGNYIDMVAQLSYILFIKIFIILGLLTIVTTAVTNILLDRKIRRSNIDRIIEERNKSSKEAAILSENS
ncbi:MAG: hypothetical protein ACM3YE_11115 [Bacteroidota bacterium]